MSIRSETADQAARDLRAAIARHRDVVTHLKPFARSWTLAALDILLREERGLTDHQRAEGAAGILDAYETIKGELS